MGNKGLLPKLAFNGIKKNGSFYFPYILTCILSAAIFFIFVSIIKNPIVKTVPHAEHMIILMIIGNVLLGIILAPFLISANSFLVKQRKTELGLYSILGLEKRHIGVILLIETFIIYTVTMGIGMVTALVFSKMVFLFLMNITGLPIETQFTMDMSGIVITLSYFGVLFIVNLIISLLRVSFTNPAELFKASKKGEKETKHVWIWTILGVFALGLGYCIAITSKIDGTIFTDFFFAIFLVVIGTYFLFTAGSIILLKRMKNNKKFYYKPENFITVSGMLYRMKKSASDLVNICIFSTMVIITLICTLTVFRGEEDAIRFLYRMDVSLHFNDSLFTDKEELEEVLNLCAEDENIQIKDKVEMTFQVLHADKEENKLSARTPSVNYSINARDVKLLTLEDYNRIENKQEVLTEKEVLIYSAAKDFKYDTVFLGNTMYQVKRELTKVSFETKEERSIARDTIYIILKDDSSFTELAEVFQNTDISDRIYSVELNVEGDKDNKEAFAEKMAVWSGLQPGFNSYNIIFEEQKMIKSMYGGLLFLGAFFGIVFSICLVLIIYYKQITEGYEDQGSFGIMKKVGMSGSDIKATMRKQIQSVFFLPFLGAIVHTCIGSFMVYNLMGSLNIYDEKIVITSVVIVIAVFGIFYAVSYMLTARAYYKIIK